MGLRYETLFSFYLIPGVICPSTAKHRCCRFSIEAGRRFVGAWRLEVWIVLAPWYSYLREVYKTWIEETKHVELFDALGEPTMKGSNAAAPEAPIVE